ncbi:MAG: hypothetical protein IPG96_14100 [Proteobacteria bacterium]|nr:hypothetical protein [Pseudomonadota bacterium]
MRHRSEGRATGGRSWGLVAACAAGLLVLGAVPAHADTPSSFNRGAASGLFDRLRAWEQRHLEPIGEQLGKLKLGRFSLDGLTLQLSGGLSLGSVGLGHAQAQHRCHPVDTEGPRRVACDGIFLPFDPIRRGGGLPPAAPAAIGPARSSAGRPGGVRADGGPAPPLSSRPLRGPGDAGPGAGPTEQDSADAPPRGWLGRGYDKFKRFGFAGVSLGYFIAATEHPQHGAPFAGLVVHQAFALFIGRGKDRGLFGLTLCPSPSCR